MILLENVKMPPGFSEVDLAKILEQRLRPAGRNRPTPDRPLRWRVLRQSLDARRRGAIHWVLRIQVAEPQETFPDLQGIVVSAPLFSAGSDGRARIVVIGAGPCGYFAALALAKAGLQPLVLEQGAPVPQRRRDVGVFWRTGRINPYSNVQFGEGGAGTFSDGKLATGIKSKWKTQILEELVLCGAPEDILYRSDPHVGTDRLGEVMSNLRRKIIRLGGEVRFYTRLSDLEIHDGRVVSVAATDTCTSATVKIKCSHLLLAVGHSARPTVRLLYVRGVRMEAKPFAIGLRIEHPQALINRIQYRTEQDELLRQLPPATYKLSARTQADRGIYTFCMCPGGFVISAASDVEQVVTNGMSLYARSAQLANSAVLAEIRPSEFGGDAHPLAGFDFQEALERRAFLAGGGDGHAPAQRAVDFLSGQISTPEDLRSASYRPGVRPARLSDLFAPQIAATLQEGLGLLNQKMDGFVSEVAVLTGVESRSSSPVRMLRDPQTLMSNIRGLYPAGEGAGLAGAFCRQLLTVCGLPK